MLRAAMAEDNPYIRIQLVQLLSSLGLEVLHCAETGEELLDVISSAVDIVFLDISLPGISGVEVAQRLRGKYPGLEIVFVTSHEEYVCQAIELYATDYIRKPIDVSRLKQTIDRVQNRLIGRERVLEIPLKDCVEFVPEQDIYVVEARGHKTCIYTESKILEGNISLKAVEKMVSPESFFRTSRFCLVNVEKVSEIRPLTKTSYELSFNGKGYTAQLSKGLFKPFRLAVKKYQIG